MKNEKLHGDATAPPDVRKKLVLARAANVHSRISLATDALAVADLLLAMQASVRAVGKEPKQ